VTRYRDLGLTVGLVPPGPGNAITDVEGVRVGTVTLIRGDGPLVIGTGPVRTGVTVIVPHDEIGAEPLFAGCHRLNGNGELTGLEWVRESGQLTTPLAITNTHSVGVVHDAIVAADVRRMPDPQNFWSLPVVGETYDGTLNDINGFHVTQEHLDEALAAAAGGPVPEGNVGGGTGMICHEFKGGTGTASRTVNGHTVGALVQANHGRRPRLAVDGVPVGRELETTAIPSP
jgi:D-aminopeptidase